MALTKKQREAIIDLIKRENLYLDYVENAQWSNFCKTLVLSDVLLLKIKNVNAVQRIIEKIDELNRQVDPEERITCRVAAGGRKDQVDSNSFSLTPWVEADIIINLDLAASDEYAIEQIDETTVRAKPGPQIKAFDEILDSKKLATKSPPSLIHRVTPFGLAAIGCHGTDMKNGAYSDNIKSITFLLMNGQLKKIDRNTNPDDFDLIASAHLGLFGIVVEMELECKPAEKLERIETAMSFPEFVEAVETGELPRKDYPMLSVFYVPTYDNDLENREHKNVKVIEYKPVPLYTENENFNPECDDLAQWLQVELEENLRVTDVLALFPKLVPLFMRYIVAHYAVGDGTVKSIGPAPAQYHYQTRYPNSINDLDGLFPLSADFHEMVAAFKKVAKETQEAKERGEAPVTFGAYGRIFQNKRYPATLAPGSHHSEKDYTCGFDVVSSPGAAGFERFRDTLVQYLIEELNSKLHWGKYVPLDKGIDYEKMYGKDMQKFKKTLKKFYRDNGLELEKSPFLTAFPCQILSMKKYMPAVQDRITVSHELAPVHPIVRMYRLAKFLIWIEKQHEMHPSVHLDALKRATQELHQSERAKMPGSSRQSIFGKGESQQEQAGVRRCPPCTLF